MTRLVVLTMAATLLPACEHADADPDAGDSDGADETVVDDLAEPEALPAGWREITFPEQIIPAGSEKQNCYFLGFEDAEIYSDTLRAFQGAYGHHAVLFYTIAPEPVGTVRDCTGAADMVTLVPAIIPTDVAVLPALPEGMAVRIPKGTQLVVQQHYVNTSDVPIRVRDVVQFSVVPAPAPENLVGLYAANADHIDLAAEAGVEQVREFDCVAPHDMKLLFTIPHMHEWGTKFSASVTRKDTGEVVDIFDELAWNADFRDRPPTKVFGRDHAFELHEGDVIHTKCVFDNNTGKPLDFPSEMCVTTGYYFPAPLGDETWTCGG